MIKKVFPIVVLNLDKKIKALREDIGRKIEVPRELNEKTQFFIHAQNMQFQMVMVLEEFSELLKVMHGEKNSTR